MKDHSNCRRGFHHYRAAWYSRSLREERFVDQIMIGMYAYEGGTSGEFAIRWLNVGGKVTPRLEVFDDAWHALSMFSDVLSRLAELDGQDVSPDDMVAILSGLGIEDLTERHNPDDSTNTGVTREFYVVVAGQDADEQFLLLHPDSTPRGPIAWETYLDDSNTFERATAHAKRLAKTHRWARVGKLIVEDWPEDAS